MSDDAIDGALRAPVLGVLEVSRMMEASIREAGLAPGSKLPTEREWTVRTGQSRTVVRRALARLEATGRIDRHVGRGTFLAGAPERAGEGADAALASSPSEIMAVRLLIEPAAMPMVVTSARQADFEEMARCLDGGDHDRGYEQFEQWDAAFHRSLAVATQNSLLVSMIDLLNQARDQKMWGQLKRRSFTYERTHDYMRDHRDIAEAVYDRDGTAAEEMMRRHLLRVRSHLLGF